MLTIHNTEAIRRIEAAIGYTFHDKRLLVQVLTRKTYLKIDPEAPDNEVLEFYGDTLMNYHVTNYFMSKYAHMLEDGLFFMRTVEQFTDLRSHYVCNRYLTERVKALGLARYLRAQNRETELRRDSEKAYADIFESLVGAVYLDSYQNDSLIRSFILGHLGIDPKRAPADIEVFDFDTLRDTPEDTLSDEPDEALLPSEDTPEGMITIPAWADNTEDTPVHILTEESSLTDLLPEVEADPATEELPAMAEEVIYAPTTSRERLSLLCEELGFEQPTYGETPPNAPNARPVAACTLKYKDARGKQVKISLNDSGKNLAEATEKAAAKMLVKVEKIAADIRNSSKAEKPAKSNTNRRIAVKDTIAPEVQAPDVTVPPVEEVSPAQIPVEEPTAEAIPNTPDTIVLAAEIPAEAPASVESVQTVAEDVISDAPAAEPLTQPLIETNPPESKPIKKSSATKKATSKKKALTEKQPPVAVVVETKEEAPKAEEQPVKKTASKKKTTVKKEALTEHPTMAVVEEIKKEAPKAEEQPVKKTASKKKATVKKEAITEQSAVAVAEEVKVEATQAKAKPTKKSAGEKATTKKSTTKKSTTKKASAASKIDAE